MEIVSLAIPDVKLITPKRLSDPRGLFSEVYSRQRFADAGIDVDFVQENHSVSVKIGTIRGLHFQTPPFAQDKLVRVTRGRIYDVAVDVRRASPTFGHHVATELSAENWRQLFVPVGFAHGFVTLEENTEVVYKVSNIYAPQNDAGILWSDPDLAIDWNVTASLAITSEKDSVLPRLRDLVSPF